MKGAGIIFLNSNNEVLLLLRDDKIDIPFSGMWDIPGGKIEENESPEDGVRREMSEELGLNDLGEIELFRIFTSENLTDYVYWTRLDLNPEEIDLKEGQKIEYFSQDQIKETKLAFNYNEVLEEFFSELLKR
jgi:8-oxo-dGTP diphosphatase